MNKTTAAKPHSLIKSLWLLVLSVGLDTLIAKYVLGTVVLTFVLGWAVTWPMAILVAAISQFVMSVRNRPDQKAITKGETYASMTDEEKATLQYNEIISSAFYYFIRLSLMGWCLFVRFLL